MKKVAIILAGAIVSLGLGACAPPAHPLPCTAVAGGAVQGGIETVVVHSVAGAGVLARATYRHTNPGVLTSTNAAGLAHLSFPVPDAGYRVKVTVITVKGHQAGSCAGYFTPTRKVGKPAPKPAPQPQPKPQPKPAPGPVPPAGLKTVTCNEVDFPIPESAEFTTAHHSFNIRATDTDCITGRTLASDAPYGPHGGNGPIQNVLGYSCGFSQPAQNALYTCTNPGAPNAKVTFEYGSFPSLACLAPANVSLVVTLLSESNSDCSFADAVAADVYTAPLQPTFGASYSAAGFNCQAGVVENGPANYRCYTPDRLSSVTFTLAS